MLPSKFLPIKGCLYVILEVGSPRSTFGTEDGGDRDEEGRWD